MIKVMRALEVVVAMVREVFGEAPYQRYLAQHGVSRSSESFAAFLREREGGRPRVRCC